MASTKGIIERAPLPPPNAPLIGEKDRSRIFGLIGQQLQDVLNGPGSYYPDGVKKSPDALMDDLTSFYSSVEGLGRQLNDPSNIMGDVLNELQKFNAAFAPATKWSDPHDERDKAIELPRDVSPTTRDQNIMEVDPGFGVPYPIPYPYSNQSTKERPISDTPSSQAPAGEEPSTYRRLATRLVFPSR
ncbi:hypothetical protein ACQR1W_38170 [Bradyrhizobium sp. HKCCYLS1011]|uniref:hypothetical protein n=1 Tax=Bradyrhizobium sp. HKCCYLS1011 TaxID=3420733 RepID=UPI003EBBB6A6